MNIYLPSHYVRTFMKIPPLFVNYVEQTMGLRFKKIPVLKKVDGKTHTQIRWLFINRQVVEVTDSVIKINRKDFKIENEFDLLYDLLHEMRDSIIQQNMGDISVSKIHKITDKYLKKDAEWLIKNSQRGWGSGVPIPW